MKKVRLSEPASQTPQQNENPVWISGQENYQRSDEHKSYAFKLGYAAIGFDGVSVDVFQLLVYAVKALLAAVGKCFAGFHALSPVGSEIRLSLM
jgi:hypothetical protein